jgi:aspartate aminotransferase
MKDLSIAALNVDGQPMFKLLDTVQNLERNGADILHFELGEPDFDTPKHIVDAAIKSLRDGETHYVNSMGLLSLREAICETTQISRGFTPNINQTLVTPGGNAIIYLAISCLVDPGYEVIVPDPGFPTYYSAIKYCGAIPVSVPLYEKNQFKLDPIDLEKKITPKTRLIIINSPSNPTGAAMSKDDLYEIYMIAKKYDIYLLSDEIYARMIFEDNFNFYSPGSADKCKERTIIINGFSKAFSMTGWRVGVAIGPEEIIKKMGLVLQTIVSCVPMFVQQGALAAIKGDQSCLLNMYQEYKKRRDILVEGLNSIKGISCLKPEGAMYVFPNIKDTGFSSEDFAHRALHDAGVALLPGNNFGREGEGYVRLCYVNSLDKINKAVEKLSQRFN